MKQPGFTLEEIEAMFGETDLNIHNKQKVAIIRQKFKSLSLEIKEMMADAKAGGREVTRAITHLRDAQTSIVTGICMDQRERNRLAKEAAGQ